MAYRNLLNITCTDKEELFQRLRDFICAQDDTDGTYDYSTTGIGWTMHDEVYATDKDNCALNDYFVIYSPGENGDEDLYIQVIWYTTYIRFHGFQSWDASAHSGSTNRFIGASNFEVSETVSPWILWVYGDLNSLMLINDMFTVGCHACQIGKLLPIYDDISEEIATCSSTLTAGSDISITLDAIPSNWAVGKEVFIRTTHNDAMATVKIEKIEIKTLVSLTITADLTNSYTANSKLSDFVGYWGSNTNRLVSTGNVLIGPSGNISLATVTGVCLVLPTGSFDPDNYEERYYLLDYVISSTFGGIGIQPNLKKVPTFTAGFVISDILEEEDGTEWRCFNTYSNTYVGVKEV